MFANPNNILIAISIAVCQAIVASFCVVSLRIIVKSREAIANANKKISLNEQATRENMADMTGKLEESGKLVERIATFGKNINKRINNFLTLACDESDLYYYNIRLLQEEYRDISPDNQKATKANHEQQEKELKRYEESLYTLYNRYIKGVFEELYTTINFYLKTKGIPRNISLSMKLFDVTYHIGASPTAVRVFTAFRDKETYEKTIREIGERHYSIDKNCDFQLCLTKESYIRNNIVETAEDYANENFPSLLQYYNSAVVVPIICDYKSDKNIFGYLCCDTLNSDLSVEVFDKQVSSIMYSAALTIGMFFDTVNSCWQYTKGFEDREFLTFVHDKCYKGK